MVQLMFINQTFKNSDYLKNEVIKIQSDIKKYQSENKLILEKIKEPALFWLDAHFINSDGGKQSYDSDSNIKSRLPLECELNHILTRVSKFNDIIIIDDVRIYEDGPYEGGTFDAHMQLLNSTVKRSQICEHNSIEPLVSAFKYTHNIYKTFKHRLCGKRQYCISLFTLAIL